MFERFLKRPSALKRYNKGPFAEERKRYLAHLVKLEYPHARLKEFNLLLLAVARAVNIEKGATVAELSKAANHWSKRKTQRGRSEKTVRHYINEFKSIGSRWLQFLGKFKEPVRAVPFSHELGEFLKSLKQEHGFSDVTVEFRRRSVEPFLIWLAARGGSLASIRPVTLKNYFLENRHRQWKRRTIVAYVQSLRGFVRYAGLRGWCAPNLAQTIDKPRIYRWETLPQGPQWSEVRRLIASVDGNQPPQIRDRAVILLLAVYGFRIGEVVGLSLDDFDWENERLRLRRPKQRTTQDYPLVEVVGEAVLRYIREVRPKAHYRNVFLRLKAPYHPLGKGSLGSQITARIKGLGIDLPHFGPHVLRHSCATHLLSKGFSLYEIGNHLGHRAIDTVLWYAKVDYPSLREVADFNLSELIPYATNRPLKLGVFPATARLNRLREVADLNLGGLL
jgi:integrase/recombinase XerD